MLNIPGNFIVSIPEFFYGLLVVVVFFDQTLYLLIFFVHGLSHFFLMNRYHLLELLSESCRLQLRVLDDGLVVSSSDSLFLDDFSELFLAISTPFLSLPDLILEFLAISVHKIDLFVPILEVLDCHLQFRLQLGIPFA